MVVVINGRPAIAAGRSAHGRRSRKWMFCALSTMYLRERLVETESAFGVL